MLQAQSQIVSAGDAFELHAPYSPTYPFIQLSELVMVMREACTKIVRRPAYDSSEMSHTASPPLSMLGSKELTVQTSLIR